MLRIENLGKRYGDHVLFQGLSQVFGPGCYVLDEQESTGKTSLLGIIGGKIAPDEGDVWIDGHSLVHTPMEAMAHLAYVPDRDQHLATQTGRGLLEQLAAEKRLSLDDTVLELAEGLGLTPHLDKRFEQMSTGMRRKVSLVAAALGDPAVVLIDGPTNGLDTQARAPLADQFSRWAQDRVVLFASHDAALIKACGARQIGVATLA